MTDGTEGTIYKNYVCSRAFPYLEEKSLKKFYFATNSILENVGPSNMLSYGVRYTILLHGCFEIF